MDTTGEFNEKDTNGNKVSQASNDGNGANFLKPEAPGDGLKNTTTGVGYSQAERDGVDPRTEGIAHKGSEALSERYNINDQANLDSSLDDFTKTISNFRHSDGSVAKNDEQL